MENVTTKFKQAIVQNVLWSIDKFYKVIEKLKPLGVDVSYWEGEGNWAMLSIKRDIIGYLWKKYPVLFLCKDVSKELEAFAKCCLINLILVEDLSSAELELEYNELKDYLEYGMNYSKFSATDLWIHTNS